MKEFKERRQNKNIFRLLPFQNMSDKDLRGEEINYRIKKLEEMIVSAEGEMEDEEDNE